MADELHAADIAAYLAAMSASLATMARDHGHETLGYLLDMARLEAENIQQQSEQATVEP